MKKLLVAVLAISVSASGAFAAKKKKKHGTKQPVVAAKATTPAAKATQSVAAVTPAVASPAPTTSMAPTADASQPAAQSTTTVGEAEKAVKKSRFGLLLNEYYEISGHDVNRQKGEAGATLTVRPSYKINDTTSVGVGVDIDHSYGQNTAGKKVWTPGDVYVQLAKSNLGTLPGGIETRGAFRFYAPTSELSQANGQIGMVRPILAFTKNIGKLGLSYNAEPRYYFQNYKTTAPNDEGTIAGTRTFRLIHYVKAELAASEKVALYTQLGLDQGWYNGDANAVDKDGNAAPIAAKRNEMLLAETGIDFAVTKNIGLTAGVTQYAPDLLRQSPNKQGPIYRDDFANYFLNGALSF